MKTKLLKCTPKGIGAAASIIKKGGTVAFPTETVYGLGANALDEKAVEKIFVAKGRPGDNPLIVHIGRIEELESLAKEINSDARKLIDKFWPGPLTLVLKKKNVVPSSVTANLDTVAIRMPRHKTALNLCRKAGVPIAAPSANLSTKPSPTKAKHVVQDLSGRIDAILIGKKSTIGLESTVIDMSKKPYAILRPGRVTLEDLTKILGKGKVFSFMRDANVTVRSPGMKYKHYSPVAEVVMFERNIIGKGKSLTDYALKKLSGGQRVAVISTKKRNIKKDGFIQRMYQDKEHLGSFLFAWFRKMDRLGVDIIIVETVDEKGIGQGVMNRLRKAATRIIKE